WAPGPDGRPGPGPAGRPHRHGGATPGRTVRRRLPAVCRADGAGLPSLAGVGADSGQGRTPLERRPRRQPADNAREEWTTPAIRPCVWKVRRDGNTAPRPDRRRCLGEPPDEERLYPEVEDRLRPLASPLPPSQVGDWLSEHVEKGQTFRQY